MDVLKFLIIVSCTYKCLASKHIIPIEEYKAELEDLGEHINYKETPVKVIKITKTIAVRVPVPYPVKVIEKVPYPVHVAKPYPVPVPQIVKIPQAAAAATPAHKLEEHYPLGYTSGDHHGFLPYQDLAQHSPAEHSSRPASEEHSVDDGGSVHLYDDNFGGSSGYEQHGASDNSNHDNELKQHTR